MSKLKIVVEEAKPKSLSDYGGQSGDANGADEDDLGLLSSDEDNISCCSPTFGGRSPRSDSPVLEGRPAGSGGSKLDLRNAQSQTQSSAQGIRIPDRTTQATQVASSVSTSYFSKAGSWKDLGGSPQSQQSYETASLVPSIGGGGNKVDRLKESVFGLSTQELDELTKLIEERKRRSRQGLAVPAPELSMPKNKKVTSAFEDNEVYVVDQWKSFCRNESTAIVDNKSHYYYEVTNLQHKAPNMRICKICYRTRSTREFGHHTLHKEVFQWLPSKPAINDTEFVKAIFAEQPYNATPSDDYADYETSGVTSERNGLIDLISNMLPPVVRESQCSAVIFILGVDFAPLSLGDSLYQFAAEIIKKLGLSFKCIKVTLDSTSEKRRVNLSHLQFILKHTQEMAKTYSEAKFIVVLPFLWKEISRPVEKAIKESLDSQLRNILFVAPSKEKSSKNTMPSQFQTKRNNMIVVGSSYCSPKERKWRFSIPTEDSAKIVFSIGETVQTPPAAITAAIIIGAYWQFTNDLNQVKGKILGTSVCKLSHSYWHLESDLLQKYHNETKELQKTIFSVAKRAQEDLFKAIEKTDDGRRIFQDPPPMERMVLGKPIERQKRALDQIDSIVEKSKEPTELVISICGEGKSGKATLLNYLLGEELFRSDPVRSVRAIRYISYGMKYSIQVRDFGGDKFMAKGDFSNAVQVNQRLQEIIRANGSQAEFVKVTAPLELLKEASFCLLPSLNQPGVNKQNVQQQLQASHTVLFVINPSGLPSQEDTILALREGLKHERIFILVNKWDQAIEVDESDEGGNERKPSERTRDLIETDVSGMFPGIAAEKSFMLHHISLLTHKRQAFNVNLAHFRKCLQAEMISSKLKFLAPTHQQLLELINSTSNALNATLLYSSLPLKKVLLSDLQNSLADIRRRNEKYFAEEELTHMLNTAVRKISEIVSTGITQSNLEAKRAVETSTVPFTTPQDYTKALLTVSQQTLHTAIEKWRVNTLNTACAKEARFIIDTVINQAFGIFAELKEIKAALGTTLNLERSIIFKESTLCYNISELIAMPTTINGQTAPVIKQQINVQLSQDSTSTLHKGILQFFTSNVKRVLIEIASKVEYEISGLEKLSKDLEKDQRSYNEVKQKLEKVQQLASTSLKEIRDPIILKLLHNMDAGEEPAAPVFTKYNPNPKPTVATGITSVVSAAPGIAASPTIALASQAPKAAPVENKKLAHMQQVANEILATEKSYVARLKSLVDMLSKLLAQLVSYQPPEVKKPIENILNNAKLILPCNEQLLTALESIPQEQIGYQAGKLFCQMAPFFKLYTDYVGNFGEANKSIDTLKKVQSIDQIITAIESSSKPPLPLGSFLIEPIQRIPRYVMLIDELKKSVPEDHPDYKNLITAYDTVKKVGNHINEAQRKIESMPKLTQIQSVIPDFNIVEPHRRFIKEGKLEMKKDEINTLKDSKRYEFDSKPDGDFVVVGVTQQYYCFLFNDILLFTTPSFSGCYNYRTVLKLQSIASIAKRENESVFVVRVVVNNIVRFLYFFTCDKEADAKSWCEEISKLLQALNSSGRPAEVHDTQKEGTLLVAQPGFIKSYWYPKWVVLKKATIFIHESADDVTPKVSVDLSEAGWEVVREQQRKRKVCKLVNGNRSHSFSSVNDDVLMEWYLKLQVTIDVAKDGKQLQPVE